MTVLQALDRYYDRMAARDEVVAPGWSTEPIGVAIVLDEDGTLLRVETWLDARGKPRSETVPKWFTRSGTGSMPNFLWDNAAYVLGLGAKGADKTARDHAAFRDLHRRELAEETDAGLVAVRRFLDAWSPAGPTPPRWTDKLATLNIAFRLGADRDFVHDRPAVRALVERLRAAGKPTKEAKGETTEGFCLVTGTRQPIAKLHPMIKNVNGASAEASLVSFNASAYTSYGKEDGFNAPTSEGAAFRYGAAINALLARGGRNRLQGGIGDASVAFWADASAYDAAMAEAKARAAEDSFSGFFDDTPPPKVTDDAQEAALVRGALEAVAAGRAERDVAPQLLDDVAFHVLGLAPNVARVSIRYWLTGTFGQFARALERHAAALDIEPRPWGAKPPSIQRLLVRTTALQEKFENIPNGLAGDVARAVLTGSPYPRTFLAAVLTRLRAGDDPGRGWHAAAIKACITRTPGQESPPVSLDPDSRSQAYQLGRLFSVLEEAQEAALGRVNASIKDRYFGAASSTPARVFGSLIRGAENHISDARKRGTDYGLDRKMTDIIARLSGDLPRSLRLEDQGRFAIGYYHQRSVRFAKRSDTATPSDTDAQELAL